MPKLTDLHRAATQGTPDEIRSLINRGADLEARTKQGHTPLHEAARGTPDNIRSLIDASADMEARDGQGWTPLHHAARYGNVAGLSTLIDAGADPDARANDGLTPLDLAECREDSGTPAKTLREAGANRSSSLPDPVIQRHQKQDKDGESMGFFSWCLLVIIGIVVIIAIFHQD